MVFKYLARDGKSADAHDLELETWNFPERQPINPATM